MKDANDERNNNDDVDQIEQEIKVLERFYRSFSEKCELVDPLDRPFPDEDGVNQGITTSELMQRI